MAIDPEQESRYISIWEKAVDTQMHFNEMCVKSRQLGLTFVAAALGVAVVLLGRGDDFALVVDTGWFKFQIHVGVVLILGAWLAREAVKGLDLNVYHKMLRGAVTFGEDFEENQMKKIFELDKGMTQAISHFSRYSDARTEKSDTGKLVYAGTVRITAEEKIKEFYKRTIRFLWIAALALFVVTNVPLWISVSPTSSDEEGDTSNVTSPPSEAPGTTNE